MSYDIDNLKADDDYEKTKDSQIRSTLRMLFLKSKERAAVLKRDEYTCAECGIKQSKRKGEEVKVQVHHEIGIDNWAMMIHAVREYILCNPKDMVTLCSRCHKNK